jgi:hypothetical protein
VPQKCARARASGCLQCSSPQHVGFFAWIVCVCLCDLRPRVCVCHKIVHVQEQEDAYSAQARSTWDSTSTAPSYDSSSWSDASVWNLLLLNTTWSSLHSNCHDAVWLEVRGFALGMLLCAQVCVCVCVFRCMYVSACVRVQVHACVSLRAGMGVNVFMCVCMCVLLRAGMGVNVSVDVFMFVCVCVCVVESGYGR